MGSSLTWYPIADDLAKGILPGMVQNRENVSDRSDAAVRMEP
ncbi:hypothetical protein [Olivibacter domesticus]|nr:hypothetical protein [Olivibacter domesticus]